MQVQLPEWNLKFSESEKVATACVSSPFVSVQRMKGRLCVYVWVCVCVCGRQHGQPPSILMMKLIVLLTVLSSPDPQARWPMLRTNLSASSHDGDLAPSINQFRIMLGSNFSCTSSVGCLGGRAKAIRQGLSIIDRNRSSRRVFGRGLQIKHGT